MNLDDLRRLADEGRALLDRLILKEFEISAAVWAHDAENDRWKLHIASTYSDIHGTTAGFGEVYDALDETRPLWLDSMDITVVGAGSTAGKDAIPMYKGFPAEKPVRYYGPCLGGTVVDHAYLYRQPVAGRA